MNACQDRPLTRARTGQGAACGARPWSAGARADAALPTDLAGGKPDEVARGLVAFALCEADHPARISGQCVRASGFRSDGGTLGPEQRLVHRSSRSRGP